MIRAELKKYSGELANKPEIVVANKIDALDAPEAVAELAEATGKEVLPISAVTGKGVSALAECLWRSVQSARRVVPPKVAQPDPPHRLDP